MPWLEQRLRPKSTEHLLARDLLGMGLLIGLAAILLWALGIGPDALRGIWSGDEIRRDMARELLGDAGDQAASVYLLMSLGFLLAMRCGAIDLSVWVVAGAGGVVAAGLMNAGLWPSAAMVCGAAAGALMGAANALLVVRLRLPSIIATSLTAVALMWGLQMLVGVRAVEIDSRAFANWHLTTTVSPDAEALEDPRPYGSQSPQTKPVVVETVYLSLSATRKLLVAAIYTLTLLVLARGRLPDGGTGGADWRRLLPAALCASGALAGAAGALWLLDHASAPVPSRPIGDLRVATAAVLAGGAFFCGRHRASLAAVWLLVALLITTIWRLEVWTYMAGGHDVGLIALLLMTLVAHNALANAVGDTAGGRVAAVGWAAATSGGMLVFAASAAASWPAGSVLRICGGGLWAVGAAGMILSRKTTALPAKIGK